MRFTDRRTTLEAWRVPKRGQDQKMHPMKVIIVRKPSLFKMRTLTHLRTQEQNVTHLRTLIISHSCSSGVGWGNNIHVPAHTQAQQPHHPSCCPADTGTALSWSVTGGVGWGGAGWGGTITFMFLRTHRHSNLIIFLAVVLTQALHFYRPVAVSWGEVVRTPS